MHGLYVKEAIAHTDNAIIQAKQRGDSNIHLIVGAYSNPANQLVISLISPFYRQRSSFSGWSRKNQASNRRTHAKVRIIFSCSLVSLNAVTGINSSLNWILTMLACLSFTWKALAEGWTRVKLRAAWKETTRTALLCSFIETILRRNVMMKFKNMALRF